MTDSIEPVDGRSAAQQRLLTALQVTAMPVDADQYVRVATAALESPSVVGVRLADEEPVFSGWQIEPVPLPAGPAGHGLFTVGELLAADVPWTVALCLPVGWAFRCAGRRLVDAVSPDGQTHVLGIDIDGGP